jgi:Family of unknown function (DUF6281)
MRGRRESAIQGRGAPGSGTADCDNQVRYQGTVYTHRGFSSQDVARVGMADASNCSDTGPDARGPYFPANPRQVEVLAFDGIPTSEAIGVRYGEPVELYVSEDVTPARADQIVDRFGQR